MSAKGELPLCLDESMFEVKAVKRHLMCPESPSLLVETSVHDFKVESLTCLPA